MRAKLYASMYFMRRPAIFWMVVLAGILADQLSKYLIFAWLHDDGQFKLIPNVLHFTPVVNLGVAFSSLAAYPYLIIAIAVVAIIAMTLIYTRYRQTISRDGILLLALCLMGAFGNLIDRVFFHHVRDFIEFVPRIPFIGHWAIFNLADIFITVGVVQYLIVEVFFRRKAEIPPPASAK